MATVLTNLLPAIAEFRQSASNIEVIRCEDDCGSTKDRFCQCGSLLVFQ